MNFHCVAEKYQRLENEKKNIRTVRKTNTGPMIRYQSLSMPVIVLTSADTVDKNADTEKVDMTEENSNKNENTLEKYIFSTDYNKVQSSSIKKKIIYRVQSESNKTNDDKNLECAETNSYYERTFVTFENEQLFNRAFKKKPTPRPTLKSLCAITRYL